MSAWNPRSELATLVVDVGFEYVPEKDIIVSRHQAWQRNVGYTWAYDVASPAAGMIIDCEPIYFTHGNKNWMIELWKGQYGLETGCEIGVYNQAAFAAPGPTVKSIFDRIRAIVPNFVEDAAERAREAVTMYCCVTDPEMLEMSFTLKRAGTVMFTRGPEKHWWLTGFRWGEFTRDTTSLTMEAAIVFPDRGMRDAFTQALHKLDYPDVRVTDLSVAFTFGKPRTKQPASRLTETHYQNTNEDLVRQYNVLKAQLKLASNDPNLIDRQALSSELQATYDAITAFFKKLKTIRSLLPIT